MHDIKRIYFEVGAARSGTSFLGQVLSRHPMLAYWDRPTYILRHGNAWKSDDCFGTEQVTPRIRNYIRRRFAEYTRAQGKDSLVVTTQFIVLALDFINEVYPECKIIHIIRDGREVASSQKGRWESHGDQTPLQLLRARLPEIPVTDMPAYAGEFAISVIRRLLGTKRRHRFGPRIKDWKRLSRSMDTLAFTGLCWKECVSAARRAGAAMPADRYHELHFEKLVREPEEVVGRLLEFMELPPSAEVEDYIKNNVNRNISGKWLKTLSEEEVASMMPHIEDLLNELGYAS